VQLEGGEGEGGEGEGGFGEGGGGGGGPVSVPQEHWPSLKSRGAQILPLHGSQLDIPLNIHEPVQLFFQRPARSDLVAPFLAPLSQAGGVASPATATDFANSNTLDIPADSIESMFAVKLRPCLFPLSFRAMLRGGTLTPSFASSLSDDSESLGQSAR